MIRSIWRMAFATAVTALAATGCEDRSITEPEAGSGSVEIHIPPPSMDIVDVSRIEITISGSGISSPIVTELDGSPATGWSGIIPEIPAGLGRTFVGRAYDGTDVLYEGSAYPVTIQPGGNSLVTLFLHEVDTPDGFFNSAPRITALVVPAYAVAPGGTLAISVTAVDPDGDPLTWAWSSPAGAFDDPTTASVVWTAPGAVGSVLLHVAASDPTGAAATLDLMITVGTAGAEGSAYVAANLNSGPEILAMVPAPSRAEVGAAVYLDLTAGDSDGDALVFSWSSSCEGSFDDPTTEDPSFTLDVEPEDGADCLLRVRVADERGGANVGELSIASGPGVCGSGPCGPTIPVPGELIWYSDLAWSGGQWLGALAVAPDGTSHLVGSELASGSFDLIIHRFDAAGAVLGRSTWATSTNDSPRSAATDATGNLYVVGSRGSATGLLMRWGAGDTPVWHIEIPDTRLTDIAVTPANDVVVVGLNTSHNLNVARFGPDGGPAAWNAQFGAGNVVLSGAGVAVDLGGNVIVCGSYFHPDTFTDPFLLKYSPTGERIWSRSPDLNQSRTCDQVAVSGSGDIYVAGRNYIPGTGDDVWIGRFDSMGNLVGTRDIDLGGLSDEVHSLVVAPDGSVYVAGRMYTVDPHAEGVWLGAYFPTLSPRWSTTPFGLGLPQVALHPDGSLIFAGVVDGGATLNDMWMGKFAR